MSGVLKLAVELDIDVSNAVSIFIQIFDSPFVRRNGGQKVDIHDAASGDKIHAGIGRFRNMHVDRDDIGSQAGRKMKRAAIKMSDFARTDSTAFG